MLAACAAVAIMDDRKGIAGLAPFCVVLWMAALIVSVIGESLPKVRMHRKNVEWPCQMVSLDFL